MADPRCCLQMTKGALETVLIVVSVIPLIALRSSRWRSFRRRPSVELLNQPQLYGAI
jgi:hypothetical protein